RPGRPRVSRELRELIQRMSKENPLWGAPRIHGELLKLGFEIAESTVSKYMIRRRGPPSQTWRTFLLERLIGTLRRECLDHVLIYGERHLRQILTLYSLYYNETRTHLGLGKDAPLRRSAQRSGTIVTTPILSGLHHRYARI